MAFGRTQHWLSLGFCVGAVLCFTRCAMETQLPQSGRGWTDVEKFAQNNFVFGGPDTGRFDVTLFEKTNDADVLALAKALVFVRTSFPWTYRQDIQRGVREIIDEWSKHVTLPHLQKCQIPIGVGLS